MLFSYLYCTRLLDLLSVTSQQRQHISSRTFERDLSHFIASDDFTMIPIFIVERTRRTREPVVSQLVQHSTERYLSLPTQLVVSCYRITIGDFAGILLAFEHHVWCRRIHHQYPSPRRFPSMQRFRLIVLESRISLRERMSLSGKCSSTFPRSSCVPSTLSHAAMVRTSLSAWKSVNSARKALVAFGLTLIVRATTFSANTLKVGVGLNLAEEEER